MRNLTRIVLASGEFGRPMMAGPGVPPERIKALRDAYGKALVEVGKSNPKVVVLDADLSGSTKTINFSQAFPERFFNMGVAEQDLMGTAA